MTARATIRNTYATDNNKELMCIDEKVRSSRPRLVLEEENYQLENALWKNTAKKLMFTEEAQ